MGEEPDFAETAVERQPLSRSKVLVSVALSIAAVLAVIGAGSLAWNFVVYHPTDRGSCLSLNPQECKSLTREAIEDMGQISLPDDAQVLRSGSSKSLKSASAYAVIELHGNSELVLGSNYRDTSSDGTVPKHIGQAGLLSIDSVSVLTENANVTRRFYLGSGEGSTRLAYIEESRDF